MPLGLDAFATMVGLEAPEHQSALRRRLRQMVDGGLLLLNRKDEYCLLEKIDAVAGVVMAHPDGFGFLRPDDGGEDVYLSFREMRPLLDGDRAAVHVTPGGRAGRRAGTVVEILQRAKSTVVGQYRRSHGIGYVVESGRASQQFLVPEHQRGGASSGDVVKLEITEYPAVDREAVGKVVRILGDADAPGMPTEVAIEQFGLRDGFPRAVTAAADRFGSRVAAADKSADGRVDLRNVPLVTIDGEDARDFDDAVFAEPQSDGWRVVVAIADVSHYVRPGEPIDGEATARGTSVYFPDRVVPMLPEALSNGLCSLNPDVDRLCMVCDMQVDASGKVSGSRFYRGVMRSAARLTYDEVDTFHRTGSGRARLQRLRTQLDHLYAVFGALLKARRRRGALDLDLPEVRIQLDEAGGVLAIVPRHRNDAHRLIEECMIAANVEAARFLRRHRLATLYRVHAGPSEDKFEELRVMLQELGIKLPDQAREQPRFLNRALRDIAGRPDSAVLSMAVLRALSQAVYQPANIGHFGLGLAYYAHFTSPIRRYPDLLVHRGIGHVLDRHRPGDFAYDQDAMDNAGRRCSEQERRADEATRYVDARLKAAYLESRVGETLPGTVTGVTHFGLFVTLDGLFVDGLVHVSTLGNDYYHLTHGGSRLSGERSGRAYALGDAVTVRVARVDRAEAKVDLALAGDEQAVPRTGRRRSSRSRRRG